MIYRVMLEQRRCHFALERNRLGPLRSSHFKIPGGGAEAAGSERSSHWTKVGRIQNLIFPSYGTTKWVGIKMIIKLKISCNYPHWSLARTYLRLRHNQSKFSHSAWASTILSINNACTFAETFQHERCYYLEVYFLWYISRPPCEFWSCGTRLRCAACKAFDLCPLGQKTYQRPHSLSSLCAGTNSLLLNGAAWAYPGEKISNEPRPKSIMGSEGMGSLDLGWGLSEDKSGHWNGRPVLYTPCYIFWDQMIMHTVLL